ncbi:ABC transporter ATP-binding protein [Halorhabdus amylolytica]|uniref:ABC transporter ATP-binding protein n=1 Tax=Halorhabdus amylolytica TaxID=2559573 RepID=UPI0010AA798C|nr:ABC transporter ATP-binding protein [Halorhabdus amylolytica]
MTGPPQQASQPSSRDRGSGSRPTPQPRSDPETPALSVDGLSKTFGSGSDAVTAVEDVSFTVESGDVVGLLGPNGAGKTTTIKSILGLVRPDAGDVRVRGIDVYEHPRRAYEHVDAMLEGARNDYWRLTVRENLRYFAAIRGHDPDSLADRHAELLAALEIESKADTQVRDLSRGMKQKVSLASVLASDVSVAFLDEPTLGLDVESSMTIRRELVRLAAEHELTLLVSSHDMDVIEAVCDRVIIMNEGRVIVDDTVPNLLDGFETTGYRISARSIEDSLIDALRSEFDVTDVDRRGDRIAFEIAADSVRFYRLMNRLQANDVQLDGVETVQPDLDDVFLEVTSNGDRESAQAHPVDREANL